MTYALQKPSDSSDGESSAPGPPVKSGNDVLHDFDRSRRLMSLDAYRGFVMLAMASSGFAFSRVVANHPELVAGDSSSAAGWAAVWDTLAYQFSHVPWTGCSFWDLIQPSFMFMVGVSMPYSYSKRQERGESMFSHALVRSVILIALGVFLQSQRTSVANFTFVNVLTQIGLGYLVVYLFWNRALVTKLAAIAGVLGGYWYYFVSYELPEAERTQVVQYVTEQRVLGPEECLQFEGFAAHWNKHTNAAAAADRRLLNLFPRNEEEWNGQGFWINAGGYQTLNFIPSIATMILGLVAAGFLRDESTTDSAKLIRLLITGAICFAVAMALDTTVWPFSVSGCDWSWCPAVKRIWSPTWAIFSAGWTFWMLGLFFWVIDIHALRGWAFPFVVVGMNSIAMYCMAQLIKPWISRMLDMSLSTINAGWLVFGDDPYAPIRESVARLFVLWLICLWMYRQRIFVRI